MFADDCGLVAHSQEDMKLLMDRLAAACSRYGLTISLKKTVVLYQPAPGKLYVPPVISTGDCVLEAVDKFTYLGSTLSREATIDEEISNRTAKASIAFGRLRERLWDRKGISSVKDQAGCLQSCGYNSLLYACETWTTYSHHLKKLSNFHLNCLRSLMRIRWQDKVPDTEVLQRSRMTRRQCQCHGDESTTKMVRPRGQNAWKPPPTKDILWRVCKRQTVTRRTK